MGSIAIADVTLADVVVPKQEPDHDAYDSMSASSPDDNSDVLEGSTEPHHEQPIPAPKRKGGRKPIYATSEERKQRNRQAQAAFRERRTEYIKQLETTIQQHEENLQNLQRSHRAAADECLMLRYKNSLLERILLEKGIDVQAELALKGSPNLRPHRAPPMIGQASPMQKAMLSRNQQARHRPSMAPPPPIQTPTPPSQHSSPSTARSPGFALQVGITSPVTDASGPPSQPVRRMPAPQHNHYAHSVHHHARNLSTNASQPFGTPNLSTAAMQESYYPASFQKHYSQLEQEYDAQPEMIDEMEGEDVDTDSFIPNFRLPPTTTQGMPVGMQASPPMTTSAASDGGGGVGAGNLLIDPYDPMLDADPFGLTASMHFPQPFAYPTAPRR